IQMHDIGIVPSGSRGWRFMPAASVDTNSWPQLRFADDRWAIGDAPFHNSLRFREQLGAAGKHGGHAAPRGQERGICFHFPFRLAAYLLKEDSQFRLEVTTSDAGAQVWVNGQVVTTEKPRAGKREYNLPQKSAPPPPTAPPAPPPSVRIAGGSQRWRGE